MEKKFKITKYSTQEYIKKSFMVIFHESSSVVNAIFLKKKLFVPVQKHLVPITILGLMDF